MAICLETCDNIHTKNSYRVKHHNSSFANPKIFNGNIIAKFLNLIWYLVAPIL